MSSSRRTAGPRPLDGPTKYGKEKDEASPTQTRREWNVDIQDARPGGSSLVNTLGTTHTRPPVETVGALLDDGPTTLVSESMADNPIHRLASAWKSNQDHPQIDD